MSFVIFNIGKHSGNIYATIEFDIQATIECRFTLKRVRDIIITYS